LSITLRKMRRKILVGSSVFFNDIVGFKPKDMDYVILDEKPVDDAYDIYKKERGIDNENVRDVCQMQ
jgi:hypothetical protein